MPVDFTQIQSGEDFELLCEDLLRAMGFTIVQSPARGSDAGVDLIVSETVKDTMGFTEERKSLVQCKHYAHSGKAVPFADVANYQHVAQPGPPEQVQGSERRRRLRRSNMVQELPR